MKSMVFVFGLLLSGVSLAAPPKSDDIVPAASATIDPAAIAAAGRLLDAMDYDRLADQVN